MIWFRIEMLTQHNCEFRPHISWEQLWRYIFLDKAASQCQPDFTGLELGSYYVKTVKAVMDGTWKSEAYWGGLEDGIVDLAPISDKVSADIMKLRRKR